jgi:hypothetical protein
MMTGYHSVTRQALSAIYSRPIPSTTRSKKSQTHAMISSSGGSRLQSHRNKSDSLLTDRLTEPLCGGATTTPRVVSENGEKNRMDSNLVDLFGEVSWVCDVAYKDGNIGVVSVVLSF